MRAESFLNFEYFIKVIKTLLIIISIIGTTSLEAAKKKKDKDEKDCIYCIKYETLKEWPESEKAVWWKIGERWEIKETGQKGDCYYPDSESFLENVDYNFSVQIIKKCWKRACSTGELFPEDEAIKDCAKNHINGWILD